MVFLDFDDVWVPWTRFTNSLRAGVVDHLVVLGVDEADLAVNLAHVGDEVDLEGVHSVVLLYALFKGDQTG